MKQSITPETALIPSTTDPSSNGSIDFATLELLARWKNQDATDDPEDIRAAEQELAEFKKAMNESRIFSGEFLLYP